MRSSITITNGVTDTNLLNSKIPPEVATSTLPEAYNPESYKSGLYGPYNHGEGPLLSQLISSPSLTTKADGPPVDARGYESLLELRVRGVFPASP